LKRLSAFLDGRPAIPPNYEINLLLVNTTAPDAHILIGQTDPRKVADAVSELIDNPDSSVGIANATVGPAIEL
jgi:hypothetical protein